MKISVLIPVYNVEKYLERCLDSVLSQNDDRYEVVIVEDCSTDSSKEILQKYEKFQKFKIYYNQQNEGLSSVRNKLISLCNTEYFIFLDSDDTINYLLIYELIDTIKKTNSDLIRFESLLYKKGAEPSNKYSVTNFDSKTGIEALISFLKEDKIFGQTWMYCYNKKIFVNNDITYPVGKIQEDFARTILVVAKANSVTSIPYVGYNYYRNENSIMENKSREMLLKKAYDVLEHYDYLMRMFSEFDIDVKLYDLIRRYLSKGVMVKLKKLDEIDYNEYMKEIKKRDIDLFSSLEIDDILGKQYVMKK